MNETIPTEIFIKNATYEQKKLLFQLHDLALKEQEITQKINKIYGSISKGIYSEGSGITLCENDDDANIISNKLRIDLNFVRSQMARLLKKAVDELGMDNIGIIKRQYPNYIKYLKL